MKTTTSKFILHPKNVLYLFISLLSIASIFYACKKNNNSLDDNYERLVYKNTVSTTAPNVILSNIYETFEIKYQNDKLDFLKEDKQWINLIKNLVLDEDHIRINIMGNKAGQMIYFPLIGDQNEAICIYKFSHSFLITKIVENQLSNGNQRISVLNISGEKIYQLEINKNNQIGNASAASNKVYNRKLEDQFISSVVGPPPVSACSDGHLSWNQCMNCLIVEHCGSNWICQVACGLTLPECIGGAAFICFAHNPTGDSID